MKHTKPNPLDAPILAMIEDPDTSAAARAYMADAIKRDPVDVANELEAMSEAFSTRCELQMKYQNVDRAMDALKGLVPGKEHRVWKFLAIVSGLAFLTLVLNHFGI